jgi:hypothetical protein
VLSTEYHDVSQINAFHRLVLDSVSSHFQSPDMSFDDIARSSSWGRLWQLRSDRLLLLAYPPIRPSLPKRINCELTMYSLLSFLAKKLLPKDYRGMEFRCYGLISLGNLCLSWKGMIMLPISLVSPRDFKRWRY